MSSEVYSWSTAVLGQPSFLLASSLTTTIKEMASTETGSSIQAALTGRNPLLADDGCLQLLLIVPFMRFGEVMLHSPPMDTKPAALFDILFHNPGTVTIQPPLRTEHGLRVSKRRVWQNLADSSAAAPCTSSQQLLRAESQRCLTPAEHVGSHGMLSSNRCSLQPEAA